MFRSLLVALVLHPFSSLSHSRDVDVHSLLLLAVVVGRWLAVARSESRGGARRASLCSALPDAYPAARNQRGTKPN